MVAFSRFVFIITMVFFYVPLGVLVIFSFNHSKTMVFTHFSLRWYHELFCNSPALWQACTNTIIIALSSSLTATVLGTLGAIGLYWYNFRFKKALQVMTFLPLILPEIIVGVSLLILFSTLRIPLSLGTVFVAHTTFNIPYVLLIVLSRLEEFDYSLVEAAYDLGASEFMALTKVIVPVSLPGIIAAFLVSVTLSLEDFVITFFVAGPGASTLPLQIYSMIRFGVSPVVNAISVVMIASSVILAFCTRGFFKYILQK